MGNQGIHELPRPHKHIPSSRHQHFFEHNSDFISIRNSSKFQSTIPTMSRPEHSAPPEIFYNEAEAEKYTNNTRMMNIQVFTYPETSVFCSPHVNISALCTISLNLSYPRRKWLSAPLNFCVCLMSRVIFLILAVAVVCLASVSRNRWFALRTRNIYLHLSLSS